MSYDDFDRQFVHRTIGIIKDYQGPHEVTLLINCLTGLLILPKERHYNKIPDDDIDNLPDDWGIRKEHILRVSCVCCGYKLRNVVRQMRNSVAHMKVTAHSADNEIKELEFKDTGFQVKIPVQVLRTFVIKLATSVN